MYTKEQLAGMSDYKIEGAIEKLFVKTNYPDATNICFDDTEGCIWYEIGGKLKGIPVHCYCSDWSATGPLMVEYGVSFIKEVGAEAFVCAEPWADYIGRISNEIESGNKNPLRAICEVILMMGESK